MDTWIEYLKNNDFISVKMYIKNGADVNDTNDTGESVLTNALRYRCDMDLLMLLIDNGADINDFDDEGISVFDTSIAYNNMKMVEYIISQGVDVNFTNRRSKFSPLMAAASYGRSEMVKLLLEHGANQNAIDTKGFSAVDFARKMNKKSVLEVLNYAK